MAEIPSHRICSKCNIDKPASEFRIDKRFNCLEARCRECGLAYTKRYRQTEQGKISNRRIALKYAKAHPERIQARIAAKIANPSTAPLPTEKQCSKCKETLPAANFRIDKRWHCLVSVCNRCKSDYLKTYRHTPEGREKINTLAKAYYQKQDRAVLAARNAIRKAVYRGKLQPPTICSQCGAGGIPIEAHHYKGYAWENRFEVLWVCKACHIKLEPMSS